MKNYKIFIGITLLCSLLLLGTFEVGAYPYPLQQYTVNTGAYPRTGSGGPFYVEPLTYGSGFATFCLELQEHIGTGTFWGTNNTYADTGGHDSDGSQDGSDYLDAKTVQLYNYFLDHATALSEDQIAAIQLAIWRTEGEVNDQYNAQWGGSTGYATISTDLKNWADLYFNTIMSQNVTDREIMVLNLYGESGENGNYNPNIKYQSLLIPINAVPEPGTLLFLGLGLVSVALFRRKK